MNHPRSPQALHVFAYNPTAAEVAAYASESDDLSVRTADVLEAARRCYPGFRLVRSGRVDRLYAAPVAALAQGIARDRVLRERETRAVVNTAWASVAREAYHG